MPPNDHSDLEVVPQSENVDQQKVAYYSPEPMVVHPPADDTNKILYDARDDEPPARARTICGLRRRTFWIVLIVAIIVIAAAVGGGVGGALSSKSSSNKGSDTNTAQQQASSSAAASNASTTPTPTSASPSTSISTIQLVGPTSTLLRDCPSSNNTIYDTTFGSTTMQFRKACELSFLNANGVDNVVSRPATSLNDCIDLCASYNVDNRTAIAQGKDRICNAVCWRNNITASPPGMCFGYTTQNVTADGESVWRYREPAETRCDGAALMNQDY